MHPTHTHTLPKVTVLNNCTVVCIGSHVPTSSSCLCWQKRLRTAYCSRAQLFSNFGTSGLSLAHTRTAQTQPVYMSFQSIPIIIRFEKTWKAIGHFWQTSVLSVFVLSKKKKKNILQQCFNFRMYNSWLRLIRFQTTLNQYISLKIADFCVSVISDCWLTVGKKLVW